MDDFTLARMIHMLAVLMWIGGVGFVTLVAMPALGAQHPPGERLAAFHRLEGRFAPQARLWVLLAGASGFWMIWRADLWYRFVMPGFWWMHAMLAVWLVFAAMLFIAEPLVLHRRMAHSPDPAGDYVRMEWGHRLLLAAALVALLGAVGGSHGLFG